MTNAERIDLFLRRFSSPETVATYRRGLEMFSDFINKPLTYVTYVEVIDWLDNIRNYSPATQFVRWNAVSSFYKWLHSTGQITTNPCAGVIAPKRVKNRKPRLPKNDQLNKLMSYRGSDMRGYRDEAMVALMANGLRIAEIAGLDWEDVYQDQGVWVARILGKGNKERIIPLNENSKNSLARWMATSPTGPGEPMFCDYVEPHDRVTTRQVQAAFDRVARHVGVTGLSPHTLRHHYATRLIRAGANVFSVQHLLGHENIATTQVYVTLDLTDLITAAELDPLNAGVLE